MTTTKAIAVTRIVDIEAINADEDKVLVFEIDIQDIHDPNVVAYYDDSANSIFVLSLNTGRPLYYIFRAIDHLAGNGTLSPEYCGAQKRDSIRLAIKDGQTVYAFKTMANAITFFDSEA